MNTTKHTPGPWTIGGRYIIGYPDAIIAVARMLGNVGQPVDANARLIAASPELYNALKYMNHVDEGYCICPVENGTKPDSFHSTSCADARKAIRKAEGGAA